MKIIWSQRAIDRAAEEAAFIASDKPEAAKKWLEGLFVAVDRLASFPRSGKQVPELPSLEYRQLAYRSHRLVYRVLEDSVAIVTVRRFKQSLQSTDLPEPAS